MDFALSSIGPLYASNSGFESISHVLNFALGFALSSIGSLYAPPNHLLANPGALLDEALAKTGLVSKILRFRRKRNAIGLANHIRTRFAPPTPMPISAPVPGLCVSLSPACEIVIVAAVINVLVGAAFVEIRSGIAIVEACSTIPGLLGFAVVMTVMVGTAVVEICSAIPGLLGSYSKRSEAFHLISTPSAVIVAPELL